MCGVDIHLGPPNWSESGAGGLSDRPPRLHLSCASYPTHEMKCPHRRVGIAWRRRLSILNGPKYLIPAPAHRSKSARGMIGRGAEPDQVRRPRFVQVLPCSTGWLSKQSMTPRKSPAMTAT